MTDRQPTGAYIFIAASALFHAGIMFMIMFVDPFLYGILTDESTGLELLTAIFYVISGFILFYAAWQQYKMKLHIGTILTILLALFFIFIGGEEESWGQWFFDYQVSEEIKAVSTQDEINIHNLEIFAGALNPHMVLNVFILLFGIVAPLAVTFSKKVKNLAVKFQLPIAHPALASWFVVALAYEKVANIISRSYIPDFEHWRHTEAMEFLFSYGIIMVAFQLAVAAFKRARGG